MVEITRTDDKLQEDIKKWNESETMIIPKNTEIEEKLLRENEELKKQIEKLEIENNLMKSLLTIHNYTYGIR